MTKIELLPVSQFSQKLSKLSFLFEIDTFRTVLNDKK